jgi:hypothetical protein
MRRAAAILFLALVPAAHAAGSDPLLSGYGGPGDGEQALLGTTLIRETPSGGGTAGVSQTAAPAPSPDAIYETPAPAAEQPAAQRPAAQRPARERPARTKPARTEPAAPAQPQRTTPAAPATPASAPAPVAGRDLALLAAILLLALALAGCARRLAVRAARERRPVPLQAP